MKNWTHIKTREQLRKKYLSYVPALMKIAQRYGYALALHGSAQRDLDLLAVPWVERPLAPESLVIAIEESMLGYSHMRSHWKREALRDPKPHGRKAYAISIARISVKDLGIAYIDLSIMPRL